MNNPSTTRVVTCLGGGQTRLESRRLRDPQSGELVLRLRVAGLCGTDIFKLDNNTVTPGDVLGHEVVGTVVETGPGTAARFVPGDRVVVPHHVPCGDCVYCGRGNETMCQGFRINLMEPGGFSELILVHAAAVASAARNIPDHLSDASAVFMEPAACVLRSIHRSGLRPEGLAVVQGAGSMGLLHLLLLRGLFPAVDVVVVDPVDDRRRFATSLGSQGTSEPGASAIATVKELSGRVGADAVFDTVGGPGPLKDALELSRHGGTVVLFAHAAADAQASFDLNELFKHERRVVGSYSGTVKNQAEVFDMLVAGKFDPTPLVTHTLGFDDFSDAVRLVKDRQAFKVLLTP